MNSNHQNQEIVFDANIVTDTTGSGQGWSYGQPVTGVSFSTSNNNIPYYQIQDTNEVNTPLDNVRRSDKRKSTFYGT